MSTQEEVEDSWSTCRVTRPKQVRSAVWTSSIEEEDLALQVCSTRYNDWIRSRVQPVVENPRVPLVIHHIWFGDLARLDAVKLSYIESWRRHHPKWEIRLWTDKTVKDAFVEWGIPWKLIQDCPNAGEQSDIARYIILERIGGIYVDVDVECVRPFDESLLCDFDFVCGMANVGARFEVGNSVIVARRNCAFIQLMVQKSTGKDTQVSRSIEKSCLGFPCQTLARTGPGLMTKMWLSRLVLSGNHFPEKWLLLPQAYFYPVPNDRPNDFSEGEISSCVTKESIAVHWWHKSWQ